MPRRSKAKAKSLQEKYNLPSDFGVLYGNFGNPAAEKLRLQIYDLSEKLFFKTIALRRTIPDGADSDARNVLDELCNRILDHHSSIQEIILALAPRRIKEYKKVREQKAKRKLRHLRQRQELKCKESFEQEE